MGPRTDFACSKLSHRCQLTSDTSILVPKFADLQALVDLAVAPVEILSSLGSGGDLRAAFSKGAASSALSIARLFHPGETWLRLILPRVGHEPSATFCRTKLESVRAGSLQCVACTSDFGPSRHHGAAGYALHREHALAFQARRAPK